jgi:hypothetical protein
MWKLAFILQHLAVVVFAAPHEVVGNAVLNPRAVIPAPLQSLYNQLTGTKPSTAPGTIAGSFQFSY